MRKGVLCGAAIMAMAVATPAVALVPASGDVALYWGQVAATNLLGSPVTTSRALAMVNVGIRDAVNASLGNPQPSYLGIAATPGADTRAAASVAAHDLLVTLDPSHAGTYNAALTASLAQIEDGPAKFAGITSGMAVASAMMSRRTGDGSAAPPTYQQVGGVGHWSPTPPGNLPPAAPQWGGVNMWMATSDEQFFPTIAPPALNSADYTAAFNEVKSFGAGALDPMDDRLLAAQFWATGLASGVQPWLQTAVTLAEAQGRSTLENANLLALVSVAVADAVITTFDVKYTTDFWRPITAIRMADLDGNSDTTADAGWNSAIITPNHPSFSSGHSAVANSAATILADAFGDATSFCVDAAPLQRCFNSFSGAAQDAANSRLWGGIHWRFDNEAGLEIGAAVARYQLASRVFNAVPEPASWALMICGFAFVGTSFRRRKVKVAYASA